jgi:transcriptional regulator of met regulon
MPTWAQVVVALAAPSGVLVALIERTRRENNRDHATNSELLRTIDRKVDGVSERMDDHIEWHLDHKER